MNSTVKFFLTLAVGCLFLSLLAVYFVDWQLVLGLAALFLILLFLVFYPEWGLYAMAALLPFQGLILYYGPFDAPYCDIAALLTFGALFSRTVLNKIDTRAFAGEYFLLRRRPGLLWAGLFAAAAALSLINATEFLPALKYLLRPIIFFYLMFVMVPANIVARPGILRRTIFILFIASLLAGANALLSVLLTSGPWYAHRAQPYIMFGKNLLGGNHNAVAEVLAVAIPCGWYLFFNAQKIKIKGWYLLGIGAAAAILLMTFSRSGWIALAVETVVFAAYFWGRKITWRRLLAGVLLAATALGLFYVGVWSKAEWIKSSDMSRLLMADVAWNAFRQQPLIGHGLNSFQNMLASTFVYYVEFDEPLESHGFVQKLLAETGLLGLLTYAALLLWVAWTLWRTLRVTAERERSLAVCFIALFAGLVAFELFSTSYFQAKMWLPLGLALTFAIEKTKDQNVKRFVKF